MQFPFLSLLAIYFSLPNTFAFQNYARIPIALGNKEHLLHRKLRSHNRPSLLQLSEESEQEVRGIQSDFDISRWLSPNTRGGVIVWSFLLTLIPYGVYQYFIYTGMEATQVGAYVGAIFVLLTNLLWASTYIFRVANKDMTYAKQLKDYENAVLQKRLEELADDEIEALMEEIELEDSKKSSPNIVVNADADL